MSKSLYSTCVRVYYTNRYIYLEIRYPQKLLPMLSCAKILAIVPVLIGLLLALAPVEWLVLPSMKLDPEFVPEMSMEKIVPYKDSLPTPFAGYIPVLHVGPKGYLLIVSPGKALPSDTNGTAALLHWYYENKEWFDIAINRYGGILFRHFRINGAVNFDDLIYGWHPDIEADVYLGTTQRRRIAGTRFIQSATEAHRVASIPTHIELSFSKMPPKRLYFFANEVNPPPGGFTPLTDFAQVWDDLSPTLKNKMLTRGLLYERWYRHEKNRQIDPLVHKTWQAMFLTENRTHIVEKSVEQGYTATWDEHDDLLLKHEAVITRKHSETGREFWCTHLNVLEATTFAVPFAWDAQIFRSKVSALLALTFQALLSIRAALGYHYGANTLYADDESLMLFEEVMHIRKTISRNTWMFPYEQGDVLMIDNHRLAHGRTPWYNGKRSVYVAYK